MMAMETSGKPGGDGGCGAATRGGGLCKHEAGWGTEHPGIGRCKFHAGSTPSHVLGAQRIRAAQAVVTYGLPREIDPHTALLEELHRTAGHVAWLAQQLRDLETEAGLIQTQYMEGGGYIERPSVWLELYHKERAHFAAVAKTCISVGIEERRVKLAEQQGELIAQIIRGTLADLKIAITPEVQAVVRRQLTLVA